MRIKLSLATYAQRFLLTLQIEDSGFGLAPKRVIEERDEDSTARHGRGLTLVHAFCSRLAWTNGGRTVEADMIVAAP